LKLGHALILFPLFTMIVTGFIYTNYQQSNTTCANNINCSTAVNSNVVTNNPLFYLLSGNFGGLFSSLRMIAIGDTPITLDVPWIKFDSTPINMPTLSIPWFKATTYPIGSFNVPNFLGRDFTINLPLLPFIKYEAVPLELGSFNVPSIKASSWPITIPSLTLAIFSMIGGAVMLFLGLGISLQLVSSGYEINEYGSRTLTVVGSGMLVWGFIQLLTGAWFLNLGYGWGTILPGLLELCFIVGLYVTITD